MKEEKIYQCECGKVFKSCQALCGHKANCQIHKDEKKQAEELLKQEREARRLPNGLFKCDNPNCINEHDGSYGSGRFCSKSCYKSYVGIQSGKSKKNRKHTNPIKRLKDRAPYGTWKCKRCNLVFETRRQLEAHNHEVHQYHPDFLLEDGTYVEIKGWYDNKTLIKHQTFRDLGYKLQVIDKNNIEMYLTYAVEKYGNDFIKLYEET